jgi:hypothetical protein
LARKKKRIQIIFYNFCLFHYTGRAKGWNVSERDIAHNVYVCRGRGEEGEGEEGEGVFHYTRIFVWARNNVVGAKEQKLSLYFSTLQTDVLSFLKYKCLKGQCHEIFCFRFFS